MTRFGAVFLSYSLRIPETYPCAYRRFFLFEADGLGLRRCVTRVFFVSKGAENRDQGRRLFVGRALKKVSAWGRRDGSGMVPGWFRDGSGMVPGWFCDGSVTVP
jgi:hypothetical protein